jgi:hypothetical protein
VKVRLIFLQITITSHITLSGEVNADDEHWLWGDCSDNVDIGINMVINYLGFQDRRTDATDYINQHNTVVGREVCVHTFSRTPGFPYGPQVKVKKVNLSLCFN